MSKRIITKWKIVKQIWILLLKILYLKLLAKLTPESFGFCFKGYLHQMYDFEREFNKLERQYELAKLIKD